MASFDSGSKGLVRWPGLIVALIITFILTTALVGAAAYWVLGQRSVQFTLASHPTGLVFPEKAAVKFQLDKPIKLRAEQVLDAKADVSGTLSATLDKDIETTFAIEDEAEVKYSLRHRENLKVASDLMADGKDVILKIGDKEIKATLTGQLRISGEIPVELNKDIVEKVGLNVRAPAKVVLGEQFILPVKSQVDVKIPLSADLAVAGEQQQGEVMFSGDAQLATLNEVKVQVPLKSLQVQGAR